MKVFLHALFWLLLFEDLQGSTLPGMRPIRSLNTTLRTNFRGTYEKKNPCSDAEIETSSYIASHELNHHTRGDNWSDYTHKCSAIISNFLQTIGNLIRFNHKPNGSFNFYLNTSISQKQDVSGNHRSCDCLPTIVIEATDCKIPLDPSDRNGKIKASEDVCETDKFTNEAVPSADIPGQEDSRSPKIVSSTEAQHIPITQCPVTLPSEETIISAPVQYTTPEYPLRTGGEWFEVKEKSREDDTLSVSSPSTSEIEISKNSPSAPLGGIIKKEDFSPVAFYDLSRDTQSTYEPKATYFKTSLRLTPQTDPENGTVQPRILYTTTNLVTDPIQHELTPSSVVLENPLPQPGRPEPSLPFPKRSYEQTEGTTPIVPSYGPSQAPTSTVGSTFQPTSNGNEPVQLSVSGRSEPLLLPAELQPAESFLNEPSTPFVSRDQFPINPINDPESPTVPLRPQPTAAPYFNQEMPITQFRPIAPFDMPWRADSPKSSLVNQNQLEDSSFPKTSDEPMTGQFPQVETLPRSLVGNQLGAQQIPSPHQQLLAQQPYANSFPSTIPPPIDSLMPYGQSTQSPSLEQEPKPLPNHFHQIPQENRVQTDGMLSAVNQPPVGPYGTVFPPLASNPAAGLPYSDSLTTASPGPDNTPESPPAVYPVRPSLDFKILDTYSDQLPTDNQSTEKFRSSSIATSTEEIITINEKQTTPEPTLQPYFDQYAGQVPGTVTGAFDPRSEPRLPPYKTGQQLPPIPAEYSQPQSPITDPFSNSNMGDFNQPLSSQPQGTSENPEGTKPNGEVLIAPSDFRPESSLSNTHYSLLNSQKSDTVFTSNNNNRARVVPEVSTPVPSEPTFAPEYNLQIVGSPFLYANTPKPYAPTLNTEQSALNSPVASRGPPSVFSSSAPTVGNYQDAGLATGNVYALPTQQPHPPTSEPILQGVPQQLFPTPQGPLRDDFVSNNYPARPTVLNHPEQIGSKEPPASDSLVISDYQTTTVPQPFSSNDSSQPLPSSPIRFPPSTSDGTLTYDSASVSRSIGTQSDLYGQERPLETGQIEQPPLDYGLESGSLLTDSKRISDLVTPVIPSLDEDSIRPVQQPFLPAVGDRFQESLPSQQPSTDEISRPSEPPVFGSPEAVLPQEQLNQSNRGANTEQDFQESSQSGTPFNAFQPPEQNAPPQIFEKQFVEGQRTKQTVDAALPLQPVSLGLFPGNGDPSVQQLPAFPRSDTFSKDVDTTSRNFPPAEGLPNQEFNFSRPPAFPDGVVAGIPANEQSPEVVPQQPNFQLPNSSDQFSNFSADQPPNYSPSDMWEPQSQILVPYSGQPEPTIPLAKFPSPGPPYQAPFQPQNVSLAPFLPEDAPPSTGSPAEYMGFNPTVRPSLQTVVDFGNVRRGSDEVPKLFFTTPQPQPFSSDYSPLPLDGPSQTIPQQVPGSVPGFSITSDVAPTSEAQIRSSVIDTSVENNQKPEIPLLSETNFAQPVTSSQVDPAGEILPTAVEPGNSEVREGTVTPVAPQPRFASMSTDSTIRPEVLNSFDITSPPPQAYVNNGLYSPVASNPQSDQSATNIQKVINSNRERQPNSNDFGENPTLLIASRDVATSSSGLPPKDFVTYRTTTTEETTTESVINQDQFSGDNIQIPLRQFPRPVKNTQNMFFDNQPPNVGDPQQQFLLPPNHTHQRLDGPPNSIAPVVPLVPQQIPDTRQPLKLAPNFDSSAVGIPNPYNFATAYPPPLTYPKQMSSDGNQQELQSGGSLESHPTQGDVNSPMAPQETTVRDDGGQYVGPQGVAQRLPETFDSVPLNIQERLVTPYNHPRPEPVIELTNEPVPNRPNPPPLMPHIQQDRYPAPDIHPFYPQQHRLPPPALLNLSQAPKSGFIPEEAAVVEAVPGARTEMPLVQSPTISNGDVQLAKSEEPLPAAFPPAHSPGTGNSDSPNLGFDPRQISNFNTFRAPVGNFGSPAAPPYPMNQQVELSNDPSAVMRNVAPPVLPPAQRLTDNDEQTIGTGYPILRPNFNPTQGKEVEVPTYKRTPFDDQAEGPGLTSLTDSRVGFTENPVPYGPPTPPVLIPDTPPPANPLIQALESHLVIPMQEHLHQPPGLSSSFAGRPDQNAPVSPDRKIEKQVQNTPTVAPYPPGWNSRPSTNFVNSQGLQLNTPFDTPQDVPNRPQSDPHALVPDQTTPSNEPDPASTGRFDYMASPLRNSFYADGMRSGSGPEGF